MNEKIKRILKDVVEEEKIKALIENYDEVKKQPIVSIGLDSMEYIIFLSKLEEVLEIETEKIDELDTLQDVEDIFNERK